MAKHRCLNAWLFLVASMVAIEVYSQAVGGERDGADEVKDAGPAAVGVNGVPSRVTGGPDAYGHIWDDGVPFQAIDITTSGALVFSGDDVGGVVTLEGSGVFNFYGIDNTALAMTSNGYLSTDLSDAGPDLSNDCPLPALPSTPLNTPGGRLYPMHDDLISDGYYQYFASCPRPPDSPPFTQGCHVFQWANVNHFGGGGPWSQWAILYDTSMDMVFQIGSGNPEHGAGSTTGIQNPGATIGLTYACDTADSIPDNTAVVFLANLDIFCYVDEMIRNNNGTMTLLGFCNSIDLYAFVASNPVFLGSYVLDGELTVDISGFEARSICAYWTGSAPLTSTPLRCSMITIPTLSEWGRVAFLFFLALAGVYFIRRRRAEV